MDPVLGPIALGVAGNFVTLMAQRGMRELQNPAAKGKLADIGLISSDFEGRLRKVLLSAAKALFEAQPEYERAGIAGFLGDTHVASEIAKMLVTGDPPDFDALQTRLRNYIAQPFSSTPAALSSGVSPETIINAFLERVTYALAEQADEGTLWLSTRITEVRSSIDRLISATQTFHQNIPTLFDRAIAGQHSEETRRFEEGYLQHIGKRFGRLTTPGARELHGVNQNLSIAYISLNMRAQGHSEPARAEEFLAQNPLLLVRGPAGSGKTTLLNWVTLKCADISSQNVWKGGIPFFVPLRTVARTDNGVPVVDNFVQYSTDAKVWASSPPPNWLYSILKEQRRAIIMIDGVDELPPSKRPGFWLWLSDFLAEYPGNRVIVTSRTLPGTLGSDGIARTEQWNPPSSFTDTQLEEMSNDDILQFVEHWHDAVDQDRLDEYERRSLHTARETLPRKLIDPANRRIRELCSTPLLCAMVCVLHWREEGYLPRHRVDVYEKCCDMLIEARDLKRNIEPPSGPIAAMTKNDKEMVLQRLAFDMMNNRPDSDESSDVAYRVEISRDKAVEWIRPKISSFQMSEARDATPSSVLDFLIERTGLLREPATGLIDFPHRTFQEYLAACAAGADSQEEFLAKQADDDQWHETIMLAAGTSTGGVSFGRDLIGALVNRAERHRSAREKSQRVRKTCFALALGCLENLKQQDPSLRDRVLSNLKELVPPRSDGDARILSVAGDAAIPHLQYATWKEERTTTVAACAQALRLIGTTTSLLTLMDGYVGDQRPQVADELCKTAAVPFADIPFIAKAVKDTGRLPSFVSVADMSLLDGLQGLNHLVIAPPEPKSLHTVGGLQDLRSLSIESIPLDRLATLQMPRSISELMVGGAPGTDLGWISELQELRVLRLVHLPEVQSLSPLAGLLNLEELDLLGVQATTLTPLEGLSALRQLRIDAAQTVNDITPIVDLPSLRQLHIEDCESLFDMRPLSSLRGLTELHIEDMHAELLPRAAEMPALRLLSIASIRSPINLSFLEGASQIERLTIRECQNLESFEALSGMVGLRRLEIVNAGWTASLPRFGAFSQLESLVLAAYPGAQTLSDLADTRLRELEVEYCPGLNSLEAIGRISTIEKLNLRALGTITEIDALGALTELRTLELSDSESVDDLSFLAGLPLRRLTLSSLPNLVSLEPLRLLSHLEELDIIGCGAVRDLSPLASVASLKEIRVSGANADGANIPESLLPKVKATPAGVWHRTRYLRRYYLDGQVRYSPGTTRSRVYRTKYSRGPVMWEIEDDVGIPVLRPA